MSSPRIDFYGNYHKALRRALFEFSARAGLLDYDDDAALAKLLNEFEQISRTLREHSVHEDEYMHPLLSKYAPEVQARMEQQHSRLDPELEVLEAQLRDIGSAPNRPAAGDVVLCRDQSPHRCVSRTSRGRRGRRESDSVGALSARRISRGGDAIPFELRPRSGGDELRVHAAVAQSAGARGPLQNRPRQRPLHLLRNPPRRRPENPGRQ